jgi:proline iminopeptidase
MRGVRRPGGRANTASAGVLLTLVLSLNLAYTACDVHRLSAPGAIVPPTAAEDPRLPQLRVSVAGRERALHLRTFGDPAQPVLLVLPGGPGADFRLLLPLQALADRYHVVMWDPRGAGLSERVTARELTLHSFMEEIAAVHDAVARDRPATLVGHSHGAGLFLRYAIHRSNVKQLVLIEPGPLTRAARRHYRGGAVSWPDGQDFFWQNEFLASQDHAAADYKGIGLIPLASRNFTCTGDPPAAYPMWRFGAFHYHVVTHGSQAPAQSFNWADGIDGIEADTHVLAGSCGAAGAEFQRHHNLDALPDVPLTIVPGAGHISLFTSHAEETLSALRSILAEYP